MVTPSPDLAPPEADEPLEETDRTRLRRLRQRCSFDRGTARAGALAALVEHMAAGRSAEARMPTDAELDATLFLRLASKEGSVKIRTGGPSDDEVDLAWPVWAGHVPVRSTFGEPVPDLSGGPRPLPEDVAALSR